MAKAPIYRGQGTAPFRSEQQDQILKRGQAVPYDINGAPVTTTVTWGDIGGTLPDQADLQDALDAKQAADQQLTDIAALAYAGNALKVVRVNAAATGFELATVASGGVAWGGITGTLTDQADLNTALGLKFDKAGGVITGNTDIGTSGAHVTFNAFGVTSLTSLVGGALKLKTGNAVLSGLYLEFFRDGTSPTTRSGFLGYGSGANDNINLWNEVGSVVIAASNVAKLTLTATEITATVDILVPNEAYGAGWNGSLEVPTKDAIYDKIESLGSGVADGDKGDVAVSGSGATWTVEAALAGQIPFRSAGSFDIGIGVNAGSLAITTGVRNISIGDTAGDAITSGQHNVAIGFNALGAETTGQHNIAIGRDAGAVQSGTNYNFLMGYGAGKALTTGGSNFAMGYFSLSVETTGTNNVCIGRESGSALSGSLANVAIGMYSGRELTAARYNTCLGYYAGRGVTTGWHNTLVGACVSAALGLTTGNFNTIIGANITGLAAGTANNVILADGQGNKRFHWDGTNLILTGPVVVDSLASTGDITVPDEAYSSLGWDGDLTVPTKNAVRDAIEAVVVGAGGLGTTAPQTISGNGNILTLGDASGFANMVVLADAANSALVTLRKVDATSQAQLYWDGAAAVLNTTTGGTIQLRGDDILLRSQASVTRARVNATGLFVGAGVTAAERVTPDAITLAPYRTLIEPSGSHIAGRAAGTYWFGHGQPLGITGAGTLYAPDIVYIDPADYPAVGGLSAKLRIRVVVACNDVAPGGTYTFGLHPVSRPATSGGAGVAIHTIGAAIAGSTIALATPAADSLNNVVGADFALPAAGFYVVGMVSTAAPAASSHMHMSALLQLHYT